MRNFYLLSLLATGLFSAEVLAQDADTAYTARPALGDVEINSAALVKLQQSVTPQDMQTSAPALTYPVDPDLPPSRQDNVLRNAPYNPIPLPVRQPFAQVGKIPPAQRAVPFQTAARPVALPTSPTQEMSAPPALNPPPIAAPAAPKELMAPAAPVTQTVNQPSAPVAGPASAEPSMTPALTPMEQVPLAPPVASAPVAAATPAPAAEPAADAPAFKPSGYVEGGGDYHSVTHNYGNWVGEYVKGEVQTDPDNRWNAELLNQKEFGSEGVYGDIGNTHVFNEDWYSAVTAGVGADSLYLPRYRADAFLNRKWLDSRQLITTVGLGADEFKDGHKDQSIFFGGTYYFVAPWILQGGVRINDSTPGSVTSAYEFVALTQGESKHHFLTLRYGFGREAYQILGPGQSISDFASQQLSLELRQWLGEDWGFDARGEQYHNPNYDRTGINLGVFKEF